MCAEFRSRAWVLDVLHHGAMGRQAWVLDVESQGVLKRPVLKSETWALIKIHLSYHVIHGWKIPLLHPSSGTQVGNSMTHHSGLLRRGVILPSRHYYIYGIAQKTAYITDAICLIEDVRDALLCVPKDRREGWIRSSNSTMTSPGRRHRIVPRQRIR